VRVDAQQRVDRAGEVGRRVALVGDERPILVCRPVDQARGGAAAGKDDAILLTPPIALTLEYAVEFIADDELVEITPKSIRIRKRFLKEHERKRASREAA
jgi:predicted membrane GTPase involved in stress response